MSALAKISKTAQASIEAEFWQAADSASKAEPLRISSAIYIQKIWKGFLCRKYLHNLHSIATKIQKVYRGRDGRVRFANYQRKVAEQERMRFFNAASLVIQRYWRGCFSRMFIHDFYARKRWLESVQKANEDLRQQMANMQVEQIQYIEEQRRMEEDNKFKEYIKGKHHMRSTTVCRGVFNSAYAPLKPEGIPAHRGVPVEKHLTFQKRSAPIRKDDKLITDKEATQFQVTVEKDPMFRTTFTSEELFSTYTPNHPEVQQED